MKSYSTNLRKGGGKSYKLSRTKKGKNCRSGKLKRYLKQKPYKEESIKGV